MSTYSKLGKDAGSVAYYVRERPRTPIQRSYTCSWLVYYLGVDYVLIIRG